MQESIYRRPCRGGGEVDAFSQDGKRYLIWRAGERKAIKARASRRNRRAVRRELSSAGATS